VRDDTETANGRAGPRAPSAWMRIPAATRLAIVIFLLCVLFYTLLLFLVPRYKGVQKTDGDEPHYLLTTQSLIKDGDLDVANNYRHEDYREYYDRKIEGRNVVVLTGGRTVSRASPFISLVVLPGFWLFGYKGAAMTMIFISSATASLTFLMAEKFTSRKVAAVVTLFLFLSYPLVFYSRLIYPEVAAAFLVMLGVLSSWHLKESRRPRYAVIAGLSAGLVFIFHPKFFALSASLFVLLLIVSLKERRFLAWWFLPVAVCFATLLIVYRVAYGPNLISGLTSAGGSGSMYWGTNSAWGVAGLYLDRAWGLFIFAPLYALFPLGLSLQNNRLEWTRWWLFFPICILAHTLVLGVFQSWNAGAAVVPRYLVPIAPLFVICVALLIERCRTRLVMVVAVVLGLLQIVTTVWAFRFIIGTYGIAARDNVFLEHFLDGGWLKSLLLAVFPLFHPTGPGSLLLTVAWLLLFCVTIYFARRHYLRYGGGKLSPIIRIHGVIKG